MSKRNEASESETMVYHLFTIEQLRFSPRREFYYVSKPETAPVLDKTSKQQHCKTLTHKVV